ncbi:MAG: hypothetical protein V7765_09725 [Oleispira sp.]
MRKLLVVMSILLWPLFSMAEGQLSLNREIVEARFCDVDDDCVNLGDYGLTGCNIVVNQYMAQIIQDRLDQLPGSNQQFHCPKDQIPVCWNNKCRTKPAKFKY